MTVVHLTATPTCSSSMHRCTGVCAVLLIAGLRISALSQPPNDFILKSVDILLSPTPFSVLICLPSPLIPYAPDSLLPTPPVHLGPGLPDPSGGTLRSATHSATAPSPLPTLVTSCTVPPAIRCRSVLYFPDTEFHTFLFIKTYRCKAYFEHATQFSTAKTSPGPHPKAAILDLNPGWQTDFG